MWQTWAAADEAEWRESRDRGEGGGGWLVQGERDEGGGGVGGGVSGRRRRVKEAIRADNATAAADSK